MLDRSVGGYFGLEGSGASYSLHSTGIKVQSGRAALKLLLEGIRPKAMWVPRYICNAMLTPMREQGVTLKFYGLKRDLSPAIRPRLRREELLLYVDYFGICATHVADLRARLDRRQLILDNAQAFYEGAAGIGTIYSPRKFFGVPDGGLLVSPVDIRAPRYVDRGSIRRARHLLDRADGAVARGYRSFRRAEASLADVTPRRMSTLTQGLLAAIDYDFVRRRRQSNFRYLHRHLGKINRLAIGSIRGRVPMCYPLWAPRPIDRASLARGGIFVPQYWMEAVGRCAAGSVERELIQCCLPLPCDQRYEAADLDRVVQAVSTELAR